MNCPVTDTPLHEIEWEEKNGNRIFFKRDDLQPFSFGGNKVRIAWEFLADMRAKGCDAMIMYGDRRSNLCRILSAMCRMEGVPCSMIATSEHGSEEASFNEKILSLYDVPVRFTEKNAIAEAVDAELLRFKEEGRKPYYIFGTRLGTGNEAAAARGYAKAAGEILEYEEREGIRFDRIFVPCGTGGTAGGLFAGFLERGIRRDVTAVSISSRPKERAESALKAAVEAYLAERPGTDAPGRDLAGHECAPGRDLAGHECAPGRGLAGLENAPGRDFVGLECVTEYNGGGYGLADEHVMNTVREMLLKNAIPLTPIYSGKAFAGMLSYIKSRNIKNKNLLFLHTGGLPLFFDSLVAGKI